MYGVPSRLWVKVAGMHFNGATKHWIQSLESPTHQIPWSEFCSMLLDRFACNQHESLIRQLLHIHQTTTVMTMLSDTLLCLTNSKPILPTLICITTLLDS